MTILTTSRLRLEPFAEGHLDGLNAINGDPDVMRYITGRPESPAETAIVIERVKERWAEFGFSWWAFVDRTNDQIIGSGCIQHLGRDRANPHEIGWRLRPDHWHQGLASEAAQAMAGFAFETVGAPVLLAVAAQKNIASRRVMERLGMRFRGIERWYDTDTATYEMTRADWDSIRSR
ncbi:GNAT family N-acetyltransferase [Telmatospirillum sp.]|uniref:GNAT family N-acetyltransferase n=1 Tax=Telmatospirillum sp. TaxID=2079197 RepID=UPI00283F84BC|nr:GNAT family N-acetyltransferase [Telmatospirillum sp.]MDR3435147.1 GNAT family N-acetyltransferase [Telmatospirillum sp.]